MADKRTLRQVTDTHKKAQIVVAQATGVGEMELVQRLIDGTVGSDDFIAQSVGLNQIGHEQAVRLAERYVRDVRGLIAPELVELPTVGVPFDYGQSAARAISTVKAAERAQQEATRRASAFLEGLRADAGENARRLLDSGSLTAAQARRLKQTFRKWTAASIHSAHRSTVIQSAEAVGSGWRVVTDGNPCSFCAMLASYGEDVKGARAWPSHYFHPDCGCTIQEVPFGVDVEWTDRELELIRLREEAEKYAGTSDRQGMLAYMREHGQGIVNDATIPEDERKKAGRPKKTNTSNSGNYRERVGAKSARWSGFDNPPKISLTDKAIAHILDGDANGSGGHKYGVDSGDARKTWFPESWTDEDIIKAVFRIAENPKLVKISTQSGYVSCYGESKRVRIKVRVSMGGEILTSYPLDGDGVSQIKGRAGDRKVKRVPYGANREVEWEYADD